MSPCLCIPSHACFCMPVAYSKRCILFNTCTYQLHIKCWTSELAGPFHFPASCPCSGHPPSIPKHTFCIVFVFPLCIPSAYEIRCHTNNFFTYVKICFWYGVSMLNAHMRIICIAYAILKVNVDMATYAFEMQKQNFFRHM